MRDLQIISLVDDLQLSSVTELAGAATRTLVLTGTGGFRYISRVSINDYGIDVYTVVSDRILYVPLPTIFETVSIAEMDITLISSKRSATNATTPLRLSFGPTKKVGSVSGIQKLIQHVTKVLLTNAGTNRFAPSEGGSLVRSLSLNLSEENRPAITAALATAISTTEKYILQSQASMTNLPLSERLLSFSLVGITFNPIAAEIKATINVRSFQGSSVTLPLTL